MMIKVKGKVYDKGELRRLLYRLYVLEDRTLHQVGEELGVSYTTVWLLLKKCGIKSRNRGRKPGGIVNVGIAKKLYTQGWSLKKLGQFFGVAKETVRKYLVEAGVKIRSRTWWMKRRFVGEKEGRLLQDLYIGQGKTIREIAKEMAVPYSVVWQMLKVFGVPLRRRGRRRWQCRGRQEGGDK
jgi:transposase